MLIVRGKEATATRNIALRDDRKLGCKFPRKINKQHNLCFLAYEPNGPPHLCMQLFEGLSYHP